MGNKFERQRTSKSDHDFVLKNRVSLSEKDYRYFANNTYLSQEQIKIVFDKFVKVKTFNMRRSKDDLNQSEYNQLYAELRDEPIEKLEEISKYVFELFDRDKNGKTLLLF